MAVSAPATCWRGEQYAETTIRRATTRPIMRVHVRMSRESARILRTRPVVLRIRGRIHQVYGRWTLRFACSADLCAHRLHSSRQPNTTDPARLFAVAAIRPIRWIRNLTSKKDSLYEVPLSIPLIESPQSIADHLDDLALLDFRFAGKS